jgi:hypothetical protein
MQPSRYKVGLNRFLTVAKRLPNGYQGVDRFFSTWRRNRRASPSPSLFTTRCSGLLTMTRPFTPPPLISLSPRFERKFGRRDKPLELNNLRNQASSYSY